MEVLWIYWLGISIVFGLFYGWYQIGKWLDKNKHHKTYMKPSTFILLTLSAYILVSFISALLMPVIMIEWLVIMLRGGKIE